jgi:toxin ParE1/3/4
MADKTNFKLVIKQKALLDLEEIWQYTLGNWSNNQAKKYHNLLIKEFKTIQKKPFLGKKYEYFGNCYFKKINSHYIFYFINENTIIISRILHEKMDFPQHITNL